MKKIILIISAILLLLATPVLAHEKREVAGKYSFVVGFVNEPAYSGEMNGIDLRVSMKDKPVEGLEETLKAQVLTPDGSQSMDLDFKRRYKDPGRYAAYFLPSKPGDYVFRISGSIDGTAVDERFQSGDSTFHAVEDSEALKFPK